VATGSSVSVTSAFPVPAAPVSTLRRLASAASSPASYPSLPPFGESSLIPRLLLFPPNPLRRASAGALFVATGSSVSVTPAFPVPAATVSTLHRLASAASSPASYPSLPPFGESSLIPRLLLFPPNPLRWASAGALFVATGSSVSVTSAFPVPAATVSTLRRSASASRRGD